MISVLIGDDIILNEECISLLTENPVTDRRNYSIDIGNETFESYVVAAFIHQWPFQINKKKYKFYTTSSGDSFRQEISCEKFSLSMAREFLDLNSTKERLVNAALDSIFHKRREQGIYKNMYYHTKFKPLSIKQKCEILGSKFLETKEILTVFREARAEHYPSFIDKIKRVLLK